MSHTDMDLRTFLWQQTRVVAIRWGVLVLAAVLGWGAAHYWALSLEDVVAQARAQRDAAAERKRALEDDLRLIAAHRADYGRWVESGLIGSLPLAERRALWLQQWQQALARWSDKASDYVALTLEPPQDDSGANQAAPVKSAAQDGSANPAAFVEPTAQDSGAENTAVSVTHHPFSLKVQGLTDLESLDVVQILLRELGEGARLTACDWKRADSQAVLSVEVGCRARIAYLQLSGNPAFTAATPTSDR